MSGDKTAAAAVLDDFDKSKILSAHWYSQANKNVNDQKPLSKAWQSIMASMLQEQFHATYLISDNGEIIHRASGIILTQVKAKE